MARRRLALVVLGALALVVAGRARARARPEPVAAAAVAEPPAPRVRARPREAGGLYAGDVGDRVGVSGTTVGQWARWGYIRSSLRAAEPRVYSEEDADEARVVAALLKRGVRRSDILRTVERLAPDHGPWPLRAARLATTTDESPPRVVLLEDDGAWALGGRGWQLLAVTPPYARV